MNILRFQSIPKFVEGCVILFLVIQGLSGCASSAVIAAAGVTAGFGLAQGQAESFINGELKAARLVSMQAGIDAVLKTFDELKLKVRTDRRGEHDAYFRAVAEGGPEFKVAVKFKSPVVTKFEISIGIMGDQAVSRLVQSRIDTQLGIEHPPLLPPELSPLVKPNRSDPVDSTPTSPPAD